MSDPVKSGLEAQARFRAAIEAAGGDHAMAHAWTHDWMWSANTSGSAQMRAAALRVAVPDPIDRSPRAEGEIKHLEANSRAYTVDGKEVPVREHYGNVSDSHERTFRALAAVSQAATPKEEFTVYRGLRGAQAQKIVDAIKSGAPHVDVDVGVLASFSESAAQANRFAARANSMGTAGIVIKTTVNRADVALSHRAIPVFHTGNAPSSEVVVLTKGPLRVMASDVAVKWAANPADAEAAKRASKLAAFAARPPGKDENVTHHQSAPVAVTVPEHPSKPGGTSRLAAFAAGKSAEGGWQTGKNGGRYKVTATGKRIYERKPR